MAFSEMCTACFLLVYIAQFPCVLQGTTLASSCLLPGCILASRCLYAPACTNTLSRCSLNAAPRSFCLCQLPHP